MNTGMNHCRSVARSSLVMKSLALLLYVDFVCSWNPDAGYIPSWTKVSGVTATASSHSDQANKVLDNDDKTQWNSGACLPAVYVSRADENLLLGLCAKGHCSDASGSTAVTIGVTDGDVRTAPQFKVHTADQSDAKMTMRLGNAKDLTLLSIWGIYRGETKLIVKYQNGTTEQLKILHSNDNYKQITITKVLYRVIEISVQSNSNFQIKEISSLGPEGCKERITIDLGVPREVGVVRTRHWAGSNTANGLQMKFSVDGHTWINVATLIPDALHAVITSIVPSQNVRYIQLEYKLAQKNYNKVYCWEIDAWDKQQMWGQPILANPQKSTLREILGVNGIWGWQHNKYSKYLKSGEGPFLYNAVASHARNYHNLDWDVTSPNNDPQYNKMANGQGTQAKGWLNWDTEYRAWRNASMLVDASLQFTNKKFPESTWVNPERESFELGRHFSTHFGSEHGNGLIYAVEVGNEPWDYTANFYNTVLKGMSAGLRSADSKIKILPGAFQADNKHDERNYIGTRVTQDLSVNISIVNFHTYSYRTTQNGVRVATYPEHPDSTFNSIRNIVRWRDSNMPTKPIWVTEWGWDADGQGESCSFPECVTEKAQALYGIRGLLILTRSNVEKVTWFFYANSEYCSTLYCRSGLTASKTHNFSKKTVFNAFEELLKIIGNNYFLGMLQEDRSGYVYMFSSSPFTGIANSPQDLLQQTSHVIAWKPVDVSDSSTSGIQIQLPNNVNHVTLKRFTGSIPAIEDMNPNLTGNTLNLEVSKYPVVVQLIPTDIGQVVG